MYVNISSIPRSCDSNFDINSYMYPRFSHLSNECRLYPDNLASKYKDRKFVSSLEVDDNELNTTEQETRAQMSSKKWNEERKIRFTASMFHLISRKQRNHENCAGFSLNF